MEVLVLEAAPWGELARALRGCVFPGFARSVAGFGSHFKKTVRIYYTGFKCTVRAS